MKFIDLFSGIGGFRIAFEKLGAECVFSIDNDKFACETYLNNFKTYPLGDVKKLKDNDLPDFDILCAGFPCQPFSLGGLRKGFSDIRGTLFFDIVRIINEKKPKAFLLENVKGLVNHDKGQTLQTILNILAKTINGTPNKNKSINCLNYDVYYTILNSKDFGVAQNRERIYIVGFRKKTKFKFPEKLNSTTYLENIIESKNNKSDISEILNKNIEFHLNNNLKYFAFKEKDYLLTYEVRKSRAAFRADNLSPTLTAKMGTGGNNIPILVKYKRKLSIKECLKLQGFPEDYIMKNNMQSYKQIGNSVTVPVIYAIGKEMIKFI